MQIALKQCTISESLIVVDKTANFFWKSKMPVRFNELSAKACLCKFKSRPAKNKQKKPVKIAFASWDVWLRNGPDKNDSNNGKEHVGMQKRC